MGNRINTAQQIIGNYLNPRAVPLKQLGLGAAQKGRAPASTPLQASSFDVDVGGMSTMPAEQKQQIEAEVADKNDPLNTDPEIATFRQMYNDLKNKPIRAPKFDETPIQNLGQLSEQLQGLIGKSALTDAQAQRAEELRQQVENTPALANMDLSGVMKFADMISGSNLAQGYKAPANIKDQYAAELLKLAEAKDTQAQRDLQLTKRTC
jgi:hypothetical protein